ncbi:MAG TPA: NAD-dependent epimerase/dehydratase family protein [Kribbella sp.]|nr:NAD-dependent epimerase/dehydratase family protein [Kribbella sp.]
MRIAILGGTQFIGRAIADRLVSEGHRLLLVHRGEHEPDGLPEAEHAHVDRHDAEALAKAVAPFEAEAAVDVSGMNAVAADAALGAFGADVRLVAISSCDVYRAYQALHAGWTSDPLPLDEDARLRDQRFVDGPQYENLELEERYLPRGATVLRLGAVYGEHDYQRRFEFILRRLRAGRRRIPVGSGQFLFSRVYVGDVAAAVSLALVGGYRGEAFNLAERLTAPYRLFAEQILEAADATGVELVRVPDDRLPSDLELTGVLTQHLLVDSAKARDALGWRESDATAMLRRSVRWHLDHPPAEEDLDWSADEAALAAAG